MIRSLTALLAVVTALPVLAQERPAYGPRLDGYDYPHPVAVHAFTSQRQPLEMTYMDVAPTGTANGRTAVLLHGKNFCSATWAPTIETLAGAGYRVVAIDQIGFCKASKPIGYQFSLSQLAANTEGLLEALDIEQAAIIGHSMGGMLAIRFALQHPERVERLILVNPIGLEDWQALGVPYAKLDDAYAGELRTTFDSIKAYQQRIYYDGAWRAEYDPPVSMLAGMYAGEGREVVAWNQAQTSDMIFTQPVVHELGLIQAPTTLLIGQKDRTAPGSNRATPALQASLGDYPVLGRQAAEAIPNATLIAFENLGHSPQTEAPEVFHSALLADLAN